MSEWTFVNIYTPGRGDMVLQLSASWKKDMWADLCPFLIHSAE